MRLTFDQMHAMCITAARHQERDAEAVTEAWVRGGNGPYANPVAEFAKGAAYALHQMAEAIDGEPGGLQRMAVGREAESDD